MTITVLEALTDNQRATLARTKALRVLPPEIAWAVTTRLDEALTLPGLVDRGRWRRLVEEVAALPEVDADAPATYLTTSPCSEQCVWCHAVVPAGHPLELIVSYGARRFWACQLCAAETRVGTSETTNEEKYA